MIITIVLIILFFCLIILLFTYTDYLAHYNTNLKFSELNKKLDYDNKKTCILISGQIRDNYYNILLLQKLFLIDPLNADVFCVFNDDIDEKDKKKIENLLNPKYIIWLKNGKNDFNNNYTPNLNYMFQKIYLCNNLKKQYESENNFIYDFAIRIRPDIYIKSKVPTKIFNNIDNNTFYSPCLFKLDYSTNVLKFGVTDQIWMSNSTVMNSACDIFLKMLNKQESSENLCQSPEIFLKKYLLKNNIKIEYFYNFRFIIDKLNNEDESIISTIYYLSKKPLYIGNCFLNSD